VVLLLITKFQLEEFYAKVLTAATDQQMTSYGLRRKGSMPGKIRNCLIIITSRLAAKKSPLPCSNRFKYFIELEVNHVLQYF
jgi:hypothetical protein